jgi:Spy/CpxP family protein refolding chaperone
MKKSVHFLLLLCLVASAFSAVAEGLQPPPPPPGYAGGGYGQMQRQRPQYDWREMSPEERERLREERRQQRRDAWREMSPEERHQLRRDIRDAGRLYRRGQFRD